MWKNPEVEVKTQVMNGIASEKVTRNDIWSKETAFFLSLEHLSAEGCLGTNLRSQLFKETPESLPTKLCVDSAAEPWGMKHRPLL